MAIGASYGEKRQHMAKSCSQWQAKSIKQFVFASFKLVLRYFLCAYGKFYRPLRSWLDHFEAERENVEEV
jgi:hypothetical protein